ncbi:MAG: RecX family transcriptional regulator [Chloroflexi bacterium]|nr:RecX family transcriptional regulator [Chloroflexota bacterium]
MRITTIEKQQRRRRANVFVDGRFTLALSLEVIADAGLRVGDEVTPDRLEALRDADARQQALNSALRLLSYRPRSEAELRLRLARKGAAAALVDETLARLRSLGLLDDGAFARYWVESRQQLSPRGRRLLWRELTAKGVDRETVQEAVASLDDAEAAYRAGEKRARTLKALEFPEFRRRLGDFLIRRGFDYDVVAEVTARLWREREEATSPDER